MEYTYKLKGVCASEVSFELEEDGTIKNVRFTGGCNGNLQGIGRIIEGMDIDEVINRVDGIQCGPRPTSCPDQLARALKQYKAEHA